MGRPLYAPSLAVNQPLVEEGIASLWVIRLGAVCLLAPLDQEAGAILQDHLLLGSRRGVNSSHDLA